MYADNRKFRLQGDTVKIKDWCFKCTMSLSSELCLTTLEARRKMGEFIQIMGSHKNRVDNQGSYPWRGHDQ